MLAGSNRSRGLRCIGTDERLVIGRGHRLARARRPGAVRTDEHEPCPDESAVARHAQLRPDLANKPDGQLASDRADCTTRAIAKQIEDRAASRSPSASSTADGCSHGPDTPPVTHQLLLTDRRRVVIESGTRDLASAMAGERDAPGATSRAGRTSHARRGVHGRPGHASEARLRDLSAELAGDAAVAAGKLAAYLNQHRVIRPGGSEVGEKRTATFGRSDSTAFCSSWWD
jgi:hypothetical protein